MKRLTLLRHAKSGLDDAVLRDFDRTLNAKGRRAARTVGEHLRRTGLAWDHAVASPAARVQQLDGDVPLEGVVYAAHDAFPEQAQDAETADGLRQWVHDHSRLT